MCILHIITLSKLCHTSYNNKLFNKVKDHYESIEIEDLKFTIKWVGALIAEVSDDVEFGSY